MSKKLKGIAALALAGITIMMSAPGKIVYAQDSNTMIKLMNINEIVIPSGVTKIGDNAFAYLFSLKKIMQNV